METKEFIFKGFKMNGFLMIALQLILLIVSGVCMDIFVNTQSALFIVASLLLLTAQCFIFPGYLKLEPNEVKVMVFFGKYRGTFSTTGFFWVNPFITQKKLSLRAHNLNVDPIKVNDKIGNPILIGLVLVWRLKDTYKAMFEIEAISGFSNFVQIQSDAALRQVAGEYAYDNNEGEQANLTLRSGGEGVNELLEQKLNERLAMAGMEVVEARINYLAYAPEIAAVMLRRQQASAIISAREKIVEGAVSMVKMALKQLSDENVVELDEEKKAAMASNLLVVLCADEAAQPVLNAGTLYQ
jgi:regulator of protease activity HflC (stomatin/prohibitin superfamily)